jgi:phage baseplate assembly protein W
MAKDFLGIDTKFPITGKFQRVESIDTVLQDLQILIATIPGERVMRPEYGCSLYTRIWDNLDSVAKQGLTDIRQAIETYEPRVQLISLGSQINRDTGTVNFSVRINTNNAANLVFPFQPQVKG